MVESIFAIEEAFDVAGPLNANAPRTAGSTLVRRSIIAAVEGLVAAGPRKSDDHAPRRDHWGGDDQCAVAAMCPPPCTLFAKGACGIGPLDIRDVDRLTVQVWRAGPGYDEAAHFNRQQIALYDGSPSRAVGRERGGY